MRTLYFFAGFLLFCISSNAQVGSVNKLEPYDYDTTLKGGYNTSFKADDSLQYLYLKKGNKIITELNSASRGMLYKELGYIGADFKNYFVLVHSYGSGNPHYIELIKKVTGKSCLEYNAAWIDAIEEKEVLLYSVNDVPSPKDKMTLYDIRTGQKQFFNFPADIFGAPQILNRIQIEKLTDKQLVIKYDTDKGSKRKAYNR